MKMLKRNFIGLGLLTILTNPILGYSHPPENEAPSLEYTENSYGLTPPLVFDRPSSCFLCSYGIYKPLNYVREVLWIYVSGQWEADYILGIPLASSMKIFPQVSSTVLAESMRKGGMLLLPHPKGNWTMIPFISPKGDHVAVPSESSISSTVKLAGNCRGVFGIPDSPSATGTAHPSR